MKSIYLHKHQISIVRVQQSIFQINIDSSLTYYSHTNKHNIYISKVISEFLEIYDHTILIWKDHIS